MYLLEYLMFMGMYERVCMYVCVCVCVCVFLRVSVYAYICVSTFVCMSVCVCVRACARACVNMWARYIYTNMYKLFIIQVSNISYSKVCSAVYYSISEGTGAIDCLVNYIMNDSDYILTIMLSGCGHVYMANNCVCACV